MNNALALVLAKGCSTRVPNKNVLRVGGRPILHYTLDHVRSMHLAADCAVMTESPAVVTLCQEFRICWESTEKETPLCRRAEIAVRELEQERGQRYDYVLLINADTPIRPRRLFDEALQILQETAADIVQSAVETPIHFHPYRNFLVRRTGDLVPVLPGIDQDEYSQHYPRFVSIVGGVVALRRDVLTDAGYRGLKHPSRHVRPILCPPDELLEIDTPEDLEAFRRRVEDGKHAGLSQPLAR